MNNEFDIDACNELVKSALNAREQLLAMQLKREIKRIKELEEEVYDYGSKETPLMHNWRLYWRSYQKSREKAPFGALVLCTQCDRTECFCCFINAYPRISTRCRRR